MKQTHYNNIDPRLAEILEVISRFAAGDLTARGTLANDDSILGGVMASINKLGEELQAYVAKNKYAEDVLIQTSALQDAIFNSENFSSIVTDTKGVIQIFNVGAERMLGYTADEVVNIITPADFSDPQELIVRAEELSNELETPIAAGFDALVFKASHGIEDIYELTYIRKDGRRFPAVVSVTALRDAQNEIIGYLLIGTDNTARKQADDKVRSAAQYARSLIEASLDPLVSISHKGKITDVNEATIKVTGVARKKLIGTDFSDYFTEPEKAREGYREAFSKGSVTDYPLTIRHQDGHITEVLYNASVYKDVQGGVFAAARDVTDQKQASQYARSLIEASLDPLVTISPEGKITDVNEATIKVTGVVREKLISTDFSDYFTEPEKAREGYREAFSKGSVTDYPLTIRHEEGRLIDVLYNASVYKDVQGNVLGVFAAARDVTESKRIMREFVETKNFLDNILQSSIKYSIIGKDLDQRIVSWNEGAQRNYIYTAEEIVGKNSQILHTPEDIASGAVSKMLATAYEKGLAECEFERVRKDGSRFWANLVVTRRNDAAGNPIGYLLMSSDISEQKKADDNVRLAAQYARSLIEASLDPLVTISPEGKITDVNEATIKVTGVARKTLIGTDFSDYFTDPEMARKGYRGAFSKGSVTDYPLTIRHENGHLIEVLYNASVYKDVRGNVLGVFAAARDVTDQKQASQYARSLIEASLDPLVTISPEGKITDVNEATIKVTGVVREKLIGTDFSDYFTEPEKARDGYREAFSEGSVIDYPLTIRHEDGHLTDVLYNASVYKDVQGNVLGVFAAARDITARKQAEAALLKAGALQDAIFNSANFSSIATDANGVIQIFNVGAERMLGYTADEVLNTITPADISDPREVVARAEALSAELGTLIAPGFEALVFKASRGIEDIYELTYIRKDGSRFPAVVSVTALRDAQSSIIGYLLIGTDNTVRKEIEAEQMKLDQRLRDQQFYTRSLIESNIDAIMTTDPRGIITDINNQMEVLTACTRDELIGSPVKNYFTDAARAEAGIKLVLANKKLTNYELTARARDGRETVVSYNATTFYDRERKLQGVFAAAREMTEMKRYERALQEKNVELENATRMKSEFLATMSHELRTPLNAIIGFSEALKDGLVGSLVDVQREYIGDIFSSGQHLLSLINDILDLSKVEAGMMTLELEPVDVQSLLSNSLSIIKEKAAAHGIHLELENAEDLGAPLLDVRKTKQIIYNLLANAVKFTPDGGRVTIRAQRVPRSSVGLLPGAWPVRSLPLADSEYNEFIELCVSDSGIGISVENMEKLFLPFTQIDSRLARKFEGTGLGLSLVRQMVELHGGAVAVASAEGEGSSLAVWLPLRGPGETATTLPQSDGAPAMVATEPAARIALVVEDDDHAAELIRLLLEAEGFSVLRAASGEDGLLLAAQRAFSLITLDLILPGMDGWEFLQRIRESSTMAQVPVVIMSIMGDSNRHFGLSSGAVAVLQKPVNRDQLHEALKKMGHNPAPGEKRTVLVVDDDPKAVELITSFLPATEYEVVCAYGGSEAIAMAQQRRPDLIVLALMMPQVSGFDVVEALRGDADTARIPIMVVTARQVTAQDLAELNSNPGPVIPVIEKAGVDRFHFIAEVRRVLSPKSP